MNNQVFEEVINKLILFFFLPLIQPLISTVVSLYKTVFVFRLASKWKYFPYSCFFFFMPCRHWHIHLIAYWNFPLESLKDVSDLKSKTEFPILALLKAAPTRHFPTSASLTTDLEVSLDSSQPLCLSLPLSLSPSHFFLSSCLSPLLLSLCLPPSLSFCLI